MGPERETDQKVLRKKEKLVSHQDEQAIKAEAVTRVGIKDGNENHLIILLISLISSAAETPTFRESTMSKGGTPSIELSSLGAITMF